MKSNIARIGQNKRQDSQLPLSFLASAYIREGNSAKGEEIMKEVVKESEQPFFLYN